MNSIRGERFELDLGSDSEEDEVKSHVPQQPPAGDLSHFVGNVQERTPAPPSAPKAPSLRNASGFPSHRKRPTQSRFKAGRSNNSSDVVTSVPGNITSGISERSTAPQTSSNDAEDFMQGEKRRIDEENRHKLAEMSPEEIEQERRELMESLDPSLVQRLLMRANIDADNGPQEFPGIADEEAEPKDKSRKSAKKVAFAEVETGAQELNNADRLGSASTPKSTQGKDSYTPGSNSAQSEAWASSIHFPRAPQPPELDPSSPSFLTDLHEKYFPSLPAEPEKLEWMSSSSAQNSYSSSQSGLDPKDIRFDFSGALIPPKMAAEIPVTEGLHHHGDSPDAAGYTVPELALLARSTVAAQRCIAFRTLGRILFRLGKGEFGDPGDGLEGTLGVEDTMGALARGLWGVVEKEGVLELCMAESEGQGIAGGRHQSAIAYATEAVWLWQKGGGRRMKAQ